MSIPAKQFLLYIALISITVLPSRGLRLDLASALPLLGLGLTSALHMQQVSTSLDLDGAQSGAERNPSKKHVVAVQHGAAAQKLTIVSAQYGKRDKISSLPNLPSGVEGFFFTELNLRQRRASGALTGIGWTLVHRTYHLESCHKGAWCELDTHGQYSLSVCNDKVIRGNMAAKFYKMNAYLLPELETADLILWSDADEVAHVPNSVNDLSLRATKLIGDADIVIGAHSKRSTVTSEAKPAAMQAAARTGISFDKAHSDILDGIAFMKSQGFHDDCGLFHCGEFLFRPKSPNIHRAMRYWWQFNQNYTFRDQISAPWAFKVNRVKVMNPCYGLRLAHPCVLENIIGTA